MKKSTNAEIEKRIVEVYSLLCKGHTYSEIVRYCSSNYNITSRMTDKLIKRATEKIANDNRKDVKTMRAEANIRYLRWLRKCEEEGKYKDAAYMQSRMDRINGLEVTKVEHSGEISNAVVLPTEIETRLIDALKHYEK